MQVHPDRVAKARWVILECMPHAAWELVSQQAASFLLRHRRTVNSVINADFFSQVIAARKAGVRKINARCSKLESQMRAESKILLEDDCSNDMTVQMHHSDRTGP